MIVYIEHIQLNLLNYTIYQENPAKKYLMILIL